MTTKSLWKMLAEELELYEGKTWDEDRLHTLFALEDQIAAFEAEVAALSLKYGLWSHP
jgi:hypothetical protein